MRFAVAVDPAEQQAHCRRALHTKNRRHDCVKRDELIGKMRSRVERCRRLARSTTDQQTATVLNQMADEGDADIARLLAEDDQPESR